MVFAAMSFYWVLGGTLGVSTLAQTIQDQVTEGDASILWVTAISGVAKIAGGLLALASIQSWGRAIPRRLELWLLYAGGVLLSFYGVAGFIEKLLMVTGVIDVANSIGDGPIWWYLFLWEPWWILGGVLFLLTARAFHTRTNQNA